MENDTRQADAASRRALLQGLGLGTAALAIPKIAQFAFGSTPARAAESRPVKFAVIAQQIAAQSDQRAWAGLQHWLKTTGLDKTWQITQTDAKGDPGALVSQIQDAITAKSDAIMVLFGTLTAAHSALADLERSRIPFFSLDSGWQAPALADITSNNWVMGGAYGQYMVEKLLAEGKKRRTSVQSSPTSTTAPVSAARC